MKTATLGKITEARAILEKLGYLDGRENLAACRHDLIEAHRLLGDALEAENARTVTRPMASVQFPFRSP